MPTRLDKLKSGEKYSEGNHDFWRGKSGIYSKNNKTGAIRFKGSDGKWVDATDEQVENTSKFTGWSRKSYNSFDPSSVTNSPSFDPGDNSVELTPSPIVEGNDKFSTNIDKPLWAKGRDYLKSDTGKYRMSQLKDITGDLVGSVAQYANNMKAQKALDKVAVPLPTLSGMLESNKFNNNVELSAINNNLANDNAFAQNKFSDSQTSAAMRGAARTSALENIAKSNANKNNIDAQNQYDANKINLGTTMQNNALMQDYRNTLMNKELSSIQAKQGFRNSLFGGFDNARKAEQVRQDNETDAAIKTAAYSSENRDYLSGILKDRGVRAGYRLKNGGVIPKGKSNISKMYC